MSDKLPILEIIPEIKNKLENHTIIILQAPPGAGKSTILPLHLLEEPWLKDKNILMLEPRRLAAKAVANRMSLILGEQTGTTVGYSVRFESKTSPKTRIEVVTEGILTRMLQQDNALKNTGLVIFDEFHERSLHADVALALCRDMQEILREDMRIMIMSATLDGEKIASLLGNAPILTSQGRQYPISYHYLPQEREAPLQVQMVRAIRKALTEHEGDILAFLPGASEIQRTQEILEQESFLTSIKIHPLYGDLPQQRQQEAILPNAENKRKIVLASSIAETSLTIEGIKIVIDSGFSRVPRFDLKTGLTRLETLRLTKDTADQRAGRAGRTAPGVCYRLWSEGSNYQLLQHRSPEIMEADLAPMVLELAQWGIQDMSKLIWLNPPPKASVNQARELLCQLQAIDEKSKCITERGKEMLRLPTHPRIAHMLLEGQQCGLIALATDIAALLEERDPLPKDVGTNLSLRVEALRKWRGKEYVSADRNVLERIERLASAWRKTFRVSVDNSIPMEEKIGKLLASAYPERIAKQREQNHRYRLANGKIVKMNEHDPLSYEKWLAVAHLDAGTNEGRIYLAAPLNPKDVIHLAHKKVVVDWDVQKGILIARTELRIGDIIVESSPLSVIPEQERINVLCEAVRKEWLTILPWTEKTEEWQTRLACLRKWRPQEEWPDVSNEYLHNNLTEWLSPYLSGIRKREDFLKLDMKDILSALLSWPLTQKMEKLVPETIEVPSGSQIPLKYNADGNSPLLAVRLQEVFGLLDTPSINEGQIKVVLHLLSPGYRPVQVTQDLKSFWQNTYQQVRKELRVRYQKHSWPEDPWTAQAVKGAKKRIKN